ncbi:hypothetical protein FQR65_LT14414 [Abscondita terminalis]|nr:hypothetical protein FQR65_LT14414 [Abscondita terminalis]
MEEGESFDHFLQEIKKLVKSCEFGEKEDEMLRDKIVLCIKDTMLQERLLNIENLNLEKCIEEPINTGVKTKKFKCYRCNNVHGLNECPAYGKICGRCGNKNHFRNCCRVKWVKQVEDAGDECSYETSLNIETVLVNMRSVDAMNWLETIKVNNKSIDVKLDTGAEVNLISIHTLKNLGSSVITKTNVVLEAYGGTKIKPLGKVELLCNTNSLSKLTEFIVVNHKSVPLLGLKSCIELKLVQRVNDVTSRTDKDNFIEKNEIIFQGVGKFAEKCKINLKPEAIPVVKPPRRVPLSLQSKLKDKLIDLERQNIIEKCKELVE